MSRRKETKATQSSQETGDNKLHLSSSSLAKIKAVYTTEPHKENYYISDSDDELDLEAGPKGVLLIKRYIRRHEPILEEYLDKRCCGCEYSRSAYSQAVVRSLIRGFFTLIFHWLFLIVLILSVGGTIACHYLSIYSDVPLTLLASALLFPISFGINWTFNRRETLLKDIAELKATCLAIYYCFRDWQNPTSTLDLKLRKEMWRMLVNIGRFMMHKGTTIHEIYSSFDEIAHLVEELRKEADWIRSVAARLYQYLRFLIVLFEKIRVVHDYRTPSTLRSFGLVFLTAFPILFAPLFANYAHLYGLWAGIFTSVLSATLLVGLHGIQIDCEDPCDKTGIDDLHMSVLLEPVVYMTRYQKAFNNNNNNNLLSVNVVRNMEKVRTYLSKEEALSAEEESRDGQSEQNGEQKHENQQHQQKERIQMDQKDSGREKKQGENNAKKQHKDKQKNKPKDEQRQRKQTLKGTVDDE